MFTQNCSVIGALLFAFSYAQIAHASCLSALEKLVRTSAETHAQAFVSDLRHQNRFAAISVRYDEKYQTNIYTTETAHADPKTLVARPDPTSRGLVVFFHGSGTIKASGGAFAHQMNEYAAMGFSTLGMDLPFHNQGPRSPRFNDLNYFMGWLRQMVNEYRIAGRPVYMIGHSFGPDVVAEFATRYPHDLNGGLMVSTAGFDEVTAHWAETRTGKMSFGGDVAENVAGSEWAGKMDEQMLWKNPEYPLGDPMERNPKLKLVALSGNLEEYYPAPLDPITGLPNGPNTYDFAKGIRHLLPNVDVVIEPGIGHYIFNHVDIAGNNVIAREFIRLAGLESLARSLPQIKNQPSVKEKHSDNLDKVITALIQDRTKTASFTDIDRLAQLYLTDPLFAKYMGAEKFEPALRAIIRDQQIERAVSIMNAYDKWVLAERARIVEWILSQPDLVAKLSPKTETMEKALRGDSTATDTILFAYSNLADPKEKGRTLFRARPLHSLSRSMTINFRTF